MVEPTSDDCERLVRRLLRVRSRVELTQSGLIAEASDADGIAAQLAPLWDAPNLQVAELRVNGPRIDVRVHSDDDRAWLVVMWVSVHPSATLLEAHVYERPRSFRATRPGVVVVLNGPSSVGKSSLMAAFADAADTPWAYFDEPVLGRLAAKFLAWPASAGPTTEGFLAALASAAASGNQLVVSAAAIEQERFRAALEGVPTVYVGLHAPLPILLERQRAQADKFGGLAEGSVAIHDGWVYDLSIDTAACTPSEAARLLSEFLDFRGADTR
jgi:chloramphenicol 3-O phosphotransferase